MADIFLSYKREDREKVRPLVEALQAQGWSVWWDTRIGVDEAWDRLIETELAAAKCVVVVWSKLSVDSRWVKLEAHEGLEKDRLVPVIIEGAKPPLAFKLVQATDLTHWPREPSAGAFAEVVAGVRRIAGKGEARAAPTLAGLPEDAQAYNKRGNDYFGMKDYDRAIANYTKAIELDPKIAVIRANRGQARHTKQDYDGAIADYTKAIEIDPKYAWAYRERGRAYHDKKEYGRAIADHSMAIDIDPRDVWAYYRRGIARFQQKDYDGAIADHSKSIEIDPTDAYDHWNCSNARLAKGDYDGAISDFTNALTILPNNARIYVSRGQAYEDRKQSGDRDWAAADYRKALEIDPTLRTLRERLQHLTVPELDQLRAGLGLPKGSGSQQQPTMTASEKAALVLMLIGACLCGVGLLVTSGSYEAARSAGGGSYIVMRGFVVGGAGMFLLGLWRLITSQSSDSRPVGSRATTSPVREPKEPLPAHAAWDQSVERNAPYFDNLGRNVNYVYATPWGFIGVMNNGKAVVVKFTAVEVLENIADYHKRYRGEDTSKWQMLSEPFSKRRFYQAAEATLTELNRAS